MDNRQIQILTDFDGTLTNITGDKTVGSPFYQKFIDPNKNPPSFKNGVKSDKEIYRLLMQSDIKEVQPYLLNSDAVNFLKENLKNEDVQINIISKNYADYIKGMLRYQGFTEKEVERIHVYDRTAMIDPDRPGPIYKTSAVEKCLANKNPSHILIYDDSVNDASDMYSKASSMFKNRSKVSESPKSEPGKFDWSKHLREIQQILKSTVKAIKSNLTSSAENKNDNAKKSVTSTDKQPGIHTSALPRSVRSARDQIILQSKKNSKQQNQNIQVSTHAQMLKAQNNIHASVLNQNQKQAQQTVNSTRFNKVEDYEKHYDINSELSKHLIVSDKVRFMDDIGKQSQKEYKAYFVDSFDSDDKFNDAFNHFQQKIMEHHLNLEKQRNLKDAPMMNDPAKKQYAAQLAEDTLKSSIDAYYAKTFLNEHEKRNPECFDKQKREIADFYEINANIISMIPYSQLTSLEEGLLIETENLEKSLVIGRTFNNANDKIQQAQNTLNKLDQSWNENHSPEVAADIIRSTMQIKLYQGAINNARQKIMASMNTSNNVSNIAETNINTVQQEKSNSNKEQYQETPDDTAYRLIEAIEKCENDIVHANVQSGSYHVHGKADAKLASELRELWSKLKALESISNVAKEHLHRSDPSASVPKKSF